MNQWKKTITLAMTGASGAVYGLRLIEELLKLECKVQLLVSEPGQVVLAMETDLKLPGRIAEAQQKLCEYFSCDKDQLVMYAKDQWTAPIASGSGTSDAMVVCPCTTGTLSAIATGASRSLLERAADVVLKERKTLILVPREAPFSTIHLENMLTLSRAGAVILPPNPGFYNNPESLGDIVDFVVAKILDQLGLEHQLVQPWGSTR